mmetsp:Transcript_11536/g.37912  ORF Transcript_11536/g.37912 Transcript_11536/m.37912 type:complete len:586 (+) Transcript_11536:25-1782(+)
MKVHRKRSASERQQDDDTRESRKSKSLAVASPSSVWRRRTRHPSLAVFVVVVVVVVRVMSVCGSSQGTPDRSIDRSPVTQVDGAVRGRGLLGVGGAEHAAGDDGERGDVATQGGVLLLHRLPPRVAGPRAHGGPDRLPPLDGGGGVRHARRARGPRDIRGQHLRPPRAAREEPEASEAAGPVPAAHRQQVRYLPTEHRGRPGADGVLYGLVPRGPRRSLGTSPGSGDLRRRQRRLRRAAIGARRESARLLPPPLPRGPRRPQHDVPRLDHRLFSDVLRDGGPPPDDAPGRQGGLREARSRGEARSPGEADAPAVPRNALPLRPVDRHDGYLPRSPVPRRLPGPQERHALGAHPPQGDRSPASNPPRLLQDHARQLRSQGRSHRPPRLPPRADVLGAHDRGGQGAVGGSRARREVPRRRAIVSRRGDERERADGRVYPLARHDELAVERAEALPRRARDGAVPRGGRRGAAGVPRRGQRSRRPGEDSDAALQARGHDGGGRSRYGPRDGVRGALLRDGGGLHPPRRNATAERPGPRRMDPLRVRHQRHAPEPVVVADVGPAAGGRVPHRRRRREPAVADDGRRRRG